MAKLRGICFNIYCLEVSIIWVRQFTEDKGNREMERKVFVFSSRIAANCNRCKANLVVRKEKEFNDVTIRGEGGNYI